jgi:subtilisin family serine protease
VLTCFACACPRSYDSLPPTYGSNWGAKSVHLAAPGTDILSTYFQDGSAGLGGYEFMTGTSMAAPAVAGAAALALAASNGTLTNAALASLLVRTSRPLASLQGMVVSNGVVDLYQAVSAARTALVAKASA